MHAFRIPAYSLFGNKKGAVFSERSRPGFFQTPFPMEATRRRRRLPVLRTRLLTRGQGRICVSARRGEILAPAARCGWHS
jgi:hypothetical protein